MQAGFFFGVSDDYPDEQPLYILYLPARYLYFQLCTMYMLQATRKKQEMSLYLDCVDHEVTMSGTRALYFHGGAKI